jgi:acyl carrier protein
MSPNDLKLRNLLFEILLIDEDEYLDDYGPDEIETWDSLAMVTIASAIEKEFGHALSPEEMVSLESIGNIKDILRSRGVELDA